MGFGIFNVQNKTQANCVLTLLILTNLVVFVFCTIAIIERSKVYNTSNLFDIQKADSVLESIEKRNREEYAKIMSVILISKFEKFRSTPYEDCGRLSIGYGFPAIDKHQTMTEAEANAILVHRISKLMEFVNKNFNDPNLTEGQHIALISFMYNIGRYELLKEPFIDYLTDENFEAIQNEIANYIYALNTKGKKVSLKGLIKRRTIEQKLIGAKTRFEIISIIEGT